MADLLVVAGIGIPERAVEFRTSRSSGPGGQNVNKLDTRVELLLDLDMLPALSQHQRTLLNTRLRRRFSRDGRIRIVVQKHRSQWQNKAASIQLLAEVLADALKEHRLRHATKPTSGSRQRRTESKRRRSAVKQMRRRPGGNDE